jgi:excisionase family DNA binding protein
LDAAKSLEEREPAGMEKTAETDEELVLTANDIARLLKISKRTVWAMRSAGVLPPPLKHLGRVVRWSRADFDHWLASKGSQHGKR